MKVLKIYPTSINDRFIDEAVETLRSGGIVLFPTDAVYALGADAHNPAGVKALCDLKGIDLRKEHITLVCADLSQASAYARIGNAAFREIKARVPGPYEFVLPCAPRQPKALKGCRAVGIRVPDNAIARRLAEVLGNPVAAAPIDWPGEFPEEGSDAESIALRYSDRASAMIDGGHGSLDHPEVIDLRD